MLASDIARILNQESAQAINHDEMTTAISDLFERYIEPNITVTDPRNHTYNKNQLEAKLYDSFNMLFSIIRVVRKEDEPVTEALVEKVLESGITAYDSCEGCGQTTHFVLDIATGSLAPRDKSRDTAEEREARALDCPSQTLSPLTVTLPAPSQELVIANDLRALFDKQPYDAKTSANYRFGRANNTAYWADKGMVYLSTPDGGATVLIDNERLEISTIDLDEEESDMNYAGDISFGLWAITMMDKADFELRAKQRLDLSPEEAIAHFRATVINIHQDKITLTSCVEMSDDPQTLVDAPINAAPALTIKPKF